MSNAMKCMLGGGYGFDIDKFELEAVHFPILADWLGSTDIPSFGAS